MMNILFFLSPKQDLMYVYDDFTLRQTLEKWENNRYASIPVLNRKGEYVGTLTEGDILWGLKKTHGLDLEAAEDVPISSFAHKRDYKAVTGRDGKVAATRAARSRKSRSKRRHPAALAAACASSIPTAASAAACARPDASLTPSTCAAITRKRPR